MNKKELLNLHRLYLNIMRQIDGDEQMPDLNNSESYREYSDMDIRPSSVHRKKTEHARALRKLKSAVDELNLSESDALKGSEVHQEVRQAEDSGEI